MFSTKKCDPPTIKRTPMIMYRKLQRYIYITPYGISYLLTYDTNFCFQTLSDKTGMVIYNVHIGMHIKEKDKKLKRYKHSHKIKGFVQIEKVNK